MAPIWNMHPALITLPVNTHPKSERVCKVFFSALEIFAEKVHQFRWQILRQKCVNNENKKNFVTRGHTY